MITPDACHGHPANAEFASRRETIMVACPKGILVRAGELIAHRTVLHCSDVAVKKRSVHAAMVARHGARIASGIFTIILIARHAKKKILPVAGTSFQLSALVSVGLEISAASAYTTDWLGCAT